MAPITKFPLRAFVAFTTIPALLVGGVLFYLSTLLPACRIAEHGRFASPDGVYDLVTFSRDCGSSTRPNTQAALIPAGDVLPEDAASFLSVAGAADFGPRWDAYGNIELSVPDGAEVFRQDDTVAGIAVIYR